MKISGFTFVRNALKYDYPVVESIRSMLPLCDEVVVAVGNSEDGTLELIRSIGSPKIRIIETIWDDSLREGGRVLAVETDKALAAISPDADWAFYLQADEVLHEQYIPVIRQAMEQYRHDDKVDGLLFHYLHFYGSYEYVGDSLRWYRREIRAFKNGRQVYSFRDAQGFRMGHDQMLRVKLIDAYIYHYGWVKDPFSQQRKQENFNLLWHDPEWVAKNVKKADQFDYAEVDALRKFEGTHPSVMQQRVAQRHWPFAYDESQKRFTLKERFKRLVLKLTGVQIGEYRNYRLLR